MAEKRECPQCGATVYATDDVCMSCGASLVKPQPPPQEEPTAATAEPSRRTPTPPRRPQPVSQVPVPSRIVGTVGAFWDIFPWIALAITALPIILQFTSFDPTAALSQVMFIAAIGLQGVVGLALLFWIVVDVLEQQAGIWWIFIAIFGCYPIGFLVYLLTARQ